MTNKTRYDGKKHFCKYCLQCFCSSRVLEFKTYFSEDAIEKLFK